jgi:NAD(P)-dependent dehydrogenase (short-subunit alcohol dehydrogenase family)
MTLQLAGKVALVVGGTGAIGAAAARDFAAAGAAVVIAGRNADAGRKIAGDIDHSGGQAVFIAADVTDAGSIQSLIGQVVQRFQRLDCAFNNAGWEGHARRSAEIDEADWQRMLDVKLSGTWRCMKNELAQMQKQGHGAIVNMAGNWGVQGAPNYASYSAAAHGVMGLTRSAALEYARDGIRVNAVCPGAVDTPLLDRMVGGDAGIKDAIGAQTAIGRIARPEEVARAVVWLCSDAASYVSGDGLLMTGGG